MIKKQFRLTAAGVSELETELEELKAQRGPIAERIKTAREFGDISENAEYAAARQEHERLESQVSEIEHILQNVELIKKPKADNKIQLGSVVKLKSNSGNRKTYQVVGTVEANPSDGKISDESPIGKALLSKKVGESVDITTPADKISYKIIEIS